MTWVRLSRDYLDSRDHLKDGELRPDYLEKRLEAEAIWRLSRGYLEDGELRPGRHPDPPEQGETGAGQQEAARASTISNNIGHTGGGRGAEQWSGG